MRAVRRCHGTHDRGISITSHLGGISGTLGHFAMQNLLILQLYIAYVAAGLCAPRDRSEPTVGTLDAHSQFKMPLVW